MNRSGSSKIASPTCVASPAPSQNRPRLGLAQPLMLEPKLNNLREQLRHRTRLDPIDLPLHEGGERLAVDPVIHSSSLPLIYINSDGVPKRARSAASPTGAVQLCPEASWRYSGAPAAASVRSPAPNVRWCSSARRTTALACRAAAGTQENSRGR